jgi:ketosteroid isomerase-like protein
MATDIGPPEDVAAVREVRAAIERAINDADAEGLGTHLAAEVAQTPAGNAMHGRTEIVAHQARTFEAFDIEEHFTVEQVVVVGDLAVEWGTYASPSPTSPAAGRCRARRCTTCTPTSATTMPGGSSG